MDFSTIKKHLTSELKKYDSSVKVTDKRTSLGWLKLKVTTNYFQNKSESEREEMVEELLNKIDFSLNQYPMSGYELLTPEEEQKQQPISIQLSLPLWSDILMSPEPDEIISLEDTKATIPLIVTFYSFKGGVGRSTALGLVAGILTRRNRRVVMIDFDLEAPGISVLFRSDILSFNQEEKYGVLDYLHQRSLTPQENIPEIEKCIDRINLFHRGELFLVPSGEYNENYIHRLAEFDRGTLQSFYQKENNPITQLIEDIKQTLNPDVILIDARPGFNDTSAVALFDLADSAVICFSPTDQSFEGLRWVVKAINKHKSYQGKPDIRFLLTPVPNISQDQNQIWMNQVEDWISEHCDFPEGTLINELYNVIFYNPSILTLPSLVNNVPKSILDEYLPIAEMIDASLPDPKYNISSLKISNRQTILQELKFEAATAQEIEAEQLPNLFQRTENFSDFLSPATKVILGAKGTGKSMLFRLFIEQPEAAKNLAEIYQDLSHFSFVVGHGLPRLSDFILNSIDLQNYEEQAGEESWQPFWNNYMLLQLCRFLPKEIYSEVDSDLIALCDDEHPSRDSIIKWLLKRKSASEVTKATDELKNIDRKLQEKQLKVWILYDELDAGFGSTPSDYNRRRRSLEALFSWWLESGTVLQQIKPKIFLRQDIWDKLNFTNKGHYMSRLLNLRWEEADLWRLVLRQSLSSSETFKNEAQQQLGVTIERLEKIELTQLRNILYSLWGERMGKGNKSYTYNWIRKRITDTQNNSFPRSLIFLLQEAVKREQQFSSAYNNNIILRPKALIDSVPEVSRQRVAEVRNEYSELAELLDNLQNQRSPIDESQLASIWNQYIEEVNSNSKKLIDAGIFKDRSKLNSTLPRTYSVAELYLYGLNMIRKGQR